MSGLDKMGASRDLLNSLKLCIWDWDLALRVVYDWLGARLDEVDPELSRLREEVELNQRMVAYFFDPSAVQLEFMESYKAQIFECGSCPRPDWELLYGMAEDVFVRDGGYSADIPHQIMVDQKKYQKRKNKSPGNLTKHLTKLVKDEIKNVKNT